MRRKLACVIIFTLLPFSARAQLSDSYNLALWRKYDVPKGEEEKVLAKDGGKGFEKIAKDLGFSTYTISNKELRYFGDPKAKVGGTIVLGFSNFPKCFRPEGSGSNSLENTQINSAVYETLLSRHPLSGEFIPSIASHWKISDDRSTYTFRIDPNARFSDGKPVTALDVLSSWKLLTDESLLEPSTNLMFSKYEVVVKSPYLVEVHVNEDNFRLFHYFSLALVIQADHEIGTLSGREYIDKFEKKIPVGSGEYVLLEKDIVEGEEFVLTRREDYWAKDYPQFKYVGNFDKIVNRIVSGKPSDEYLKFKNSEYDVFKFTQLTTPDWVQAEKEEVFSKGWIERYRIRTNGAMGTSGYAFNMRKEPFNDIRVRKAFAYMYPRKKIIESLLHNEYEPYDSHYPNTVYSDPTIIAKEFNPLLAVELLKEAGWKQKNKRGILTKGGKEFIVTLDVQESIRKFIEPYAEELKKVGIEVKLKFEDWYKTIRKVDERDFTIFHFSFSGMMLPNPETSLFSALADRNNNNNIHGVSNARIDFLIKQYNKEFDKTKQVEIIREIDRISDSLCFDVMGWNPRGIRIATWSKFGMPEFVLPQYSSLANVYGDISMTWWYDEKKAKELSEAKRKNSAVPSKKEVAEVKFWKSEGK